MRVTSAILTIVTVVVHCAHCSGVFAVDEGTSFEGLTEPVRTVYVAARESGPVTKVLVARGDQVSTGQLLVTLDDSVEQASRAAAAAAASGTASLQALMIERDVREKRYDSLRRLLEAGSGSAEEVAIARSDFDVATKRVDAEREQQQISKLRVRELDMRIAQRVVRSPVDGVVVDVRKQPGEFVATDDLHLVTVVRLDILRAVFFLPTSAASPLNTADRVSVRLPYHRETVVAQVEYVSPVTQPDSGLVRVHFLFANPHGTYRSGIHCFFQPQVRVLHPRDPARQAKTPVLSSPDVSRLKTPSSSVARPAGTSSAVSGHPRGATWAASVRTKTSVTKPQSRQPR